MRRHAEEQDAPGLTPADEFDAGFPQRVVPAALAPRQLLLAILTPNDEIDAPNGVEVSQSERSVGLNLVLVKIWH